MSEIQGNWGPYPGGSNRNPVVPLGFARVEADGTIDAITRNLSMVKSATGVYTFTPTLPTGITVAALLLSAICVDGGASEISIATEGPTDVRVVTYLSGVPADRDFQMTISQGIVYP